MKKVVIILICFFSFIGNIKGEKLNVRLSKCVDGDTAWFYLNGEKIKTRFLAINTPESTNKIEEYGKAASKYTCNLLKKTKKIEIEYDSESNKLDKYNRHLVWVFVDNELLQEKILNEGLGEIKYIYGDYKYMNKLENALKKAKKAKKNMYSDYNEDFYYYGILIIGLIILITKKSR